MSRRFRVLGVDDERLARATIARFVEQDERFELVGEARTGLEALDAIETLQPDLVVLDVQMPKMSGLEVAEALGPDRKVQIVFSTAHEEHALRAFETHAVDYLLKPYDRQRFQRALDKAWAQLAHGELGRLDVRSVMTSAGTADRPRRIALRTASCWLAVDLDEIMRMTADDKYVQVFTGAQPIVVRQTLAAMLARLDDDRFVRVHRGEVVNVHAVKTAEPSSHGDGILVLRDGSSVVLSRTHRADFLARFTRAR